VANTSASTEASVHSGLLKQAIIATTVAHPARVWLNCVSANNMPVSFLDFAKRNRASFPFNFARGTSVFFAQLVVREYAPTHPNVASVATGAIIASLLETPFIRKSNSAPSISPNIKLPPTRFGALLTAHYASRETGFINAVITDDNSPFLRSCLLFTGGVLFTSAFHKAAVIEATKDSVAAGITAPKLSEGFKIIGKIARGEYSHPAFAVRHPQPASYWQASVNLSYVVFNPKVVVARALYLGLFKSAFLLAKPRKQAASPEQKTLCFAPPKQ